MPYIVAHRGANQRAPQNTIPAFKEAIRNGADGVEFDVQMSKDGVLVICHNFTVDETSNGTGKVVDKTFEELRSLDFGSWFAEAYKGTQIPTLEETLDCVKDMKVINVEIKKAPEAIKREVVEKTVETVKRMGLERKVVFSSFDFSMIDIIKEIDSSLNCGLLYAPKETDCYDKRLWRFRFIEVAKGHKADAMHPFFALTKWPVLYTSICHLFGLKVNIWGIGRKYGEFLDYYKTSKFDKVDMIITDSI